jgi:hypothetical protein
MGVGESSKVVYDLLFKVSADVDSKHRREPRLSVGAAGLDQGARRAVA